MEKKRERELNKWKLRTGGCLPFGRSDTRMRVNKKEVRSGDRGLLIW